MARSTKTPRIDLEALSRRAGRALGALGWLHPEDLPERYHRPAVFKMLLGQIAGELPSKLATSRAFLDARRAVGRWAAAEQFRDTAARLYHDPRIRAIAGSQATLDYYFFSGRTKR